MCTVLLEGLPDVLLTRAVQRTPAGAGFVLVWGDEFASRLPPAGEEGGEDEEDGGRSVVVLVCSKLLV